MIQDSGDKILLCCVVWKRVWAQVSQQPIHGSSKNWKKAGDALPLKTKTGKGCHLGRTGFTLLSLACLAVWEDILTVIALCCISSKSPIRLKHLLLHLEQARRKKHFAPACVRQPSSVYKERAIKNLNHPGCSIKVNQSGTLLFVWVLLLPKALGKLSPRAACRCSCFLWNHHDQEYSAYPHKTMKFQDQKSLAN